MSVSSGDVSKEGRTRLIFVRHGESVVTVDRVIGGERTCTGLTELGRAQAQALADRLATGYEPPVDVLWTSTLPRAIETAEIVTPALGGLPLNIDPELVERRPGEADGIRFSEFGDHYELVDWRDHPHKPLAPGGESLATFHHRASAAIYSLVDSHAGETVMVVCHGGVIDVAFRSLLELPMTSRFNLWTINTSLTEMAREPSGGAWSLVRYNDAAHLDRAGHPRQ